MISINAVVKDETNDLLKKVQDKYQLGLKGDAIDKIAEIANKVLDL